MKTNNFYNSCLLFFTMSILLSCVRDDDFNVPKPDNGPDPAAGITANISIAEVKQLFSGYTTEFTSDLIVEGYVVSSDASGNFYKELYLQDHPSNPTAGIRVALDKQDLYLTYDIGRKLFINLNGLFIGEGDGKVLTIGQEVGGEITGINEAEIPDFLIKSATVKAITGKSMQFSQVTEAHIGMYVRFFNTQIHANELELPFVDPTALYSTQRTLESCEEETTFMVETSAFADFAQLILPEDNGTVAGVITREFSGNTILLVLNEASNMLYGGERCELEVAACETNMIDGEDIIFEENFEGLAGEDELYALGWSTVNVNGHEKQFQGVSFEGNTYMSVTAFGSGEVQMETWLISPEINLDGTTGERLRFDLEVGYDDGKGLTVLITDNYTGNPKTTVWKVINGTIPDGPSDGFSGFLPSGNISVNCLEGDVHIAFRYQDADPGLFTRYHIDNIKVTGNSNS